MIENAELAKPTIHLNGTSAEMLARDYGDARYAADLAYEKLKRTAPNGRDYYTQGANAMDRAEKEHRARLTKLQEVFDELETLIAHCGGD